MLQQNMHQNYQAFTKTQQSFQVVLVVASLNQNTRTHKDEFSRISDFHTLRTHADWPDGFPWLQGDDKRKVQQGTEAAPEEWSWLWEHPENLGPTPRGTPASVWSWLESRSLFERLQASTWISISAPMGAHV